MSGMRRARRHEPRRPMIRIDVACNDPDNGNFAGRAPMIQIGDIDLEARDFYGRPPRFAILAATPEGVSRFRLSGKTWTYRASKAWYGNWCWDAFWLRQLDAADFVNWLRRRRLYDCITGPSTFHEWFDGEGPPMERRLLAMLLEQEMRA